MLVSRSFRAFIVLAEELSYQKSAARLHMSRTPLIRLIKLMEDEVGGVLFNWYKGTNRLELSDYGKKIFEKLSPLYYEIESFSTESSTSSISIKSPHPNSALVETVSDYFVLQGNSNFVILEWDFVKLFNDLVISENRISSLSSMDGVSEVKVKDSLGVWSAPDTPDDKLRSKYFIQSDNFKNNENMLIFHASLVQRGFSDKVIFINNLILRAKLVSSGEAISIGSNLYKKHLGDLSIHGVNLLPGFEMTTWNYIYFNERNKKIKIDELINHLNSVQ